VKVVSHGRYIAFQTPEVSISRHRINSVRLLNVMRSLPWENCVLMTANSTFFGARRGGGGLGHPS
jgi:hypothetical protein